MHCYTEEMLREVGNKIGKVLTVDRNTLMKTGGQSAKMERGRFARVSVEVDLNKRLSSRFVILKQVFIVMYEGLDIICFNCGQYGHKREECGKRNNSRGD